MDKLWTLIYKDFLLLLRDKLGLALLFLMPMFFVFTITLLQAHRPNEASKIPVLLISHDQGKIMQSFKQHFLKEKNLAVKSLPSSQLKSAEKEVSRGQYKLLIIIPPNMTKGLTQTTQQHMVQSGKPVMSPSIQLIFDPAINNTLKDIIINQIKSFIRAYQMQVMSDVTNEVLGTEKTKAINQPIPLKISYAGGTISNAPNAVQQNIPAWALFGMFFIALPLASVMIKEREQSVLLRFYVAPISKSLLVISRIIAFMIVNLLQLWLMLLVGLIIMPLFGLPSLNLAGHITLVMIIGIFASFAATSFGMLVGAWSKNVEQASMFSPILIVIAAAVGGIMIPIYLMPESMQAFANFSPLHWAHEAFINVLTRNATLFQISAYLLYLFLFSIAACTLSLLRLKKI